MKRNLEYVVLALSCVLLAGCAALQGGSSSRVTVYEGARLIAGDGSAPVENSAFIVQNNKFVAVGRRGALEIPAGADRVDLAGKTVIPGLIDAHSHIGYMKNLTSGPQNYTRENILDHMYRFAYHGVVASMAMGTDFGELPFTLRDEIQAGRHPGAARFLTAGRGLAPEDEVKPDNMRHSAYLVVTESDARKAVQELAARKVRMVKTWVDSRGGTVRKFTPAVYTAIIDEAHKHNLPVMVHATALADAKALLRAGVDGLAHMVGDVDDELLELLKARPNVFFTLALGGPRRLVYAPWIDPPHPLVSETVAPEQIARLRTRLAAVKPDARQRAEQNWDRLARGIGRLNAAGVRIGVGTDGGGQLGDQFVGWTMHTEMENMVAGGMTPSQVIVAATRTSAGILRLDELGMVAPGKSADFVVLDANPLENITNTRRINKVFVRGVECRARRSLRHGSRSSSGEKGRRRHRPVTAGSR
jgi:imidazolonepropionase-like amidohydrolase